MGFEVAQAFVRIRPNTTGFRSETERGVKGAFSGLGKSLALLAGGVGAFDLIKHSVEDAAAVQKSMEVITAQFGSGAKAVKEFSETTAVSLGIAPHLAAATAAQFGILFHNLGIGKAPAAEMTVNLEKLAGSISAIRGIDPSTVLQQLPRAMLGNLRSLKNLGFAFSNVQIEAAAFRTEGIKLGTTLTPAQKSIAIYALVTQHLGQFQREAAKHSGDLVNVQRRLSAEWDKAKESLGKALLPVLAQAAKHLSTFLEKENKGGKITKDFTGIIKTLVGAVKLVAKTISTGWTIFSTAAHWIGGTKKAIEVLLGVLVLNKIRTFAGAMVAGFSEIRGAAITAAATADVSLTSIGATSIAVSAVMKTALISTGIGAIVVAISIGIVEIINHWNTVKRWFVDFGHWLSSHAKEILFVPVIGQVIFLVVEIIKHFNDIKAAVKRIASDIRLIFTHPIKGIERAFGDMEKVVVGVLVSIVHQIGDILSLIPTKVLGIKIPGASALHHWAETAKQWHAGGDALGTDLGLGAAKGISASSAAIQAALTATLLKAQATAAKLFTPSFLPLDPISQAILDSGKKKPVAGKAISDKFLADKEKKQIKAAKARADAAVKASQQANAERLAAARAAAAAAADSAKVAAQQAAQAVRQAQEKIHQAVVGAHKNLIAIGDSLSKDVGKFIDKQSALGVGGLTSTAAAFKKLKAQITAGDVSGIGRASAALENQISNAQAGRDQIKKRKDQIKQQIADLIDAFNKGQITAKQLNARIAADLAKQGINYKNAGKILGSAFADGFQQKIKALKAQVAALKAAAAAGINTKVSTAETSGPKIISPAKVAADERRKAEIRAERAAAAAGRRQAAADRRKEAADKKAARAAAKAAKARDKQTAILGSIHGSLSGPKAGKTHKNNASGSATSSSTLGLGYG